MIVVIEAIRGTVISAVEALHGKGVIIVGEVIRRIHIEEREDIDETAAEREVEAMIGVDSQ